MDELSIFINQFLVVYLLGMQSLMVRDHNYIGAMVGSLAIGMCSFHIYSVVGSLGASAVGTSVYFSFIAAGPLAIVCAMKTHPFIQKHLFRRH